MEPLKPAALIRKLIKYLVISEIAVILLGLLYHVGLESIQIGMFLIGFFYVCFFVFLIWLDQPHPDRLDEISSTLKDINHKLDP
jgi:hypothetical protein